MKNLIDHGQEIMDRRSWTEDHGHEIMDRKLWTGDHGQEIMDRKTEAMNELWRLIWTLGTSKKSR